MKELCLFILFIMGQMHTNAQHGKATTERKTFSRTTSISETIDADPSTIWSLLTDSDDFQRWNSTIVSLEGKIEEGEKIKLVSTLDSTRTFKLKVKKFVANEELVWGDAMGERTYHLKQDGQRTIFTMREKIGGFMFPLFANKIPSFDTSFEQFTADLKKEAESK